MTFSDCLRTTPQGLYCIPGDFWIDPHRPVARAVISHGHSDHACRGHGKVLASRETVAIMQNRFGPGFAQSAQTYQEPVQLGEVRVSLVPAGHILGSMQIVLDWLGRRLVFSGDYKRSSDPTCASFETVSCDLFITEATFGLPVFYNEKADVEVARLLSSMARSPERSHLLGAYSLGKAQRMIALLRAQGYDAPIFVPPPMLSLCQLYEGFGVSLGEVRGFNRDESLTGQLVLCPPQLLHEGGGAALDNPLTCFASGWMRVRKMAKSRGVELPLVISDHGDWPEILQTVQETGAEEVWVTHGREDALIYQLGKMGVRARALAQIGKERRDHPDEDE